MTVHGGVVYDANELVAIPLCQEALDYCTSTQTEKSSFVNFRRIALLYYKGQRQEKVRKMSLLVETEDKILNKKRMVGEKRNFFRKQSIEICCSVLVNSSAHLSQASVSCTQELSSLRDITKHGASIVLGRTDLYSGDQFHY